MKSHVTGAKVAAANRWQQNLKIKKNRWTAGAKKTSFEMQMPQHLYIYIYLADIYIYIIYTMSMINPLW